MGKQSKEYNYAYNTGYYAGIAAATAKMEQNGDDVGTFALAEMDSILARKEGYLRVGCGVDGLVWARWKWTQGSHADHYTFGSADSLCDAIAQVCERIHEVESGKRKPTRDTGYKRR